MGVTGIDKFIAGDLLAYDKGHQSTQEQVDDVNGWLGDELTGRNSSSAGR
jgi:hypothetical protein